MTVTFNSDHNDPQDSQVIIALTGSPRYILETLEAIIDNCKRYGKPIQGQEWSSDGKSHIITPVWNKEQY